MLASNTPPKKLPTNATQTPTRPINGKRVGNNDERWQVDAGVESAVGRSLRLLAHAADRARRGRVVPGRPEETVIPLTEELMNMMRHPVWEPCTQDVAEEEGTRATKKKGEAKCKGCSDFK